MCISAPVNAIMLEPSLTPLDLGNYLRITNLCSLPLNTCTAAVLKTCDFLCGQGDQTSDRPPLLCNVETTCCALELVRPSQLWVLSTRSHTLQTHCPEGLLWGQRDGLPQATGTSLKSETSHCFEEEQISRAGSGHSCLLALGLLLWAGRPPLSLEVGCQDIFQKIGCVFRPHPAADK